MNSAVFGRLRKLLRSKTIAIGATVKIYEALIITILALNVNV
jgi:uncharacterized spore protein YtfJ